ncbi:MAG: hypothetical protein ACJ71K_00700 [Nitrososphaeraceae archaeon]|jgi:hypothetical protein
MDIFESSGWIILGLLPTLCALEIACKVGEVVKKYKVKKVIEEEVEKVSAIAPK